MGKVFTAANASQLQAAINLAKAGDTIALGAGNYGDVVILNKKFTSDIKIVSADAEHPATFNTIKIFNSANIAFSDIAVKMTPTATTAAFTPAVNITGSSGITLTDSAISAGKAINGVADSATALDSTQNVLGRPTGVGIQVMDSTRVSISNNELSDLSKGISLNRVTGVTITDNEISGMRSSGVVGSAVSDAAIGNNHFSNSYPWAYDKAYGDHGDYIHLWTHTGGQTTASKNISIYGNVMEQGDGAPLMGIYLGGNNALAAPGFTNVRIENNAIIGGHFQGMRLENITNSVIADNTMIGVTGSTVVPGLVFAAMGGKNNIIEGNIFGSVSNVSPTVDATNTYVKNYVAQNLNPGSAGYYNPALFTTIPADATPAQITAIVLNALPATTTSAVYSASSAAIAGNLAALLGNPNVKTIVSSDSKAITLSTAAWESSATGLSKIVNGDGTPASVTIFDKSAAIVAKLGSLDNATNIGSIVVSDNLWMRLTADQFVNDGKAIAKLSNANGTPVSLTLFDTAANVANNLTKLAALTSFKSIVLSDTGPMKISAADYVGKQALFLKISGGYGLSVVDTAANITKFMPDLLKLGFTAGSAPFASIVVKDAQPLKLTAAELYLDRAVLSKMTYPDGTAAKVAIVDTAANIAKNSYLLSTSKIVVSVTAAADTIKTVANDTMKVAEAVTLTVPDVASKVVPVAIVAPATVTAGAQAPPTTPATATASSLIANNPAPVDQPLASTTYRGTAATVASNFDKLVAEPGITAIIVSDSATVTLSAGQIVKAEGAMAKFANANGSALTLKVADLAANISNNIDQLAATAGIRSVQATDGGMVKVSVADFIDYQPLLMRIAGTSGFAIADTAAAISANLSDIAKAQGAAGARATSLIVTDGKPVKIGAYDLWEDRSVITKLVNPDGTTGKVAIVDSAASLAENAYNISVSKVVASVSVQALDGGLTDVPISSFASQSIKGTPGKVGELLEGAFGSDRVYGHGDSNQLVGGAGRDFLFGGSGKDFFVFNRLSDSQGKLTDVVTGFESGLDKIDLRGLAALGEVSKAGLTYAGTSPFSGAHGEVHTVQAGTSQWVEIDANGDRVADMRIEIQGARPLSSTDFLL